MTAQELRLENDRLIDLIIAECESQIVENKRLARETEELIERLTGRTERVYR